MNTSIAALALAMPLLFVGGSMPRPVQARAIVTAADDKGPNHFAPPPIRGYEAAKWHDLRYQSPKYKFGRALVGLAPTAENLQRVAESQGLAYLGRDRVRFPDGTVVDCIRDFGGPKAAWQYQISR